MAEKSKSKEEIMAENLKEANLMAEKAKAEKAKAKGVTMAAAEKWVFTELSPLPKATELLMVEALKKCLGDTVNRTETFNCVPGHYFPEKEFDNVKKLLKEHVRPDKKLSFSKVVTDPVKNLPGFTIYVEDAKDETKWILQEIRCYLDGFHIAKSGNGWSVEDEARKKQQDFEARNPGAMAKVQQDIELLNDFANGLIGTDEHHEQLANGDLDLDDLLEDPDA